MTYSVLITLTMGGSLMIVVLSDSRKEPASILGLTVVRTLPCLSGPGSPLFSSSLEIAGCDPRHYSKS